MKLSIILFSSCLALLFSCKDNESIDSSTNSKDFYKTTGDPAFPKAQGFAKYAKGGRKGEVLFVTNLNNDGNGSLRKALEYTKPRTIIFNVGGVIELNNNISINHPFVTIAGQTSPGNGIILKGAGLYINTNDVIIQHIRIRPGDGSTGQNYDDRDGIDIGKDAQDVILDHISVQWAIDENISFWDEPINITVQNSIIGEALHNSKHSKGAHSMGILIGDNSKNISILNNLFISNNDRNPRLKGGAEASFVNNIVYNWGMIAAGGSIDYTNSPILANITNNIFKKGPNSSNGFFDIDNIDGSNSKIYLDGNFGDPQELVDYNANSATYKNTYSFLVSQTVIPNLNTQISSGSNFDVSLLNHIGASKPKRDLVDARLITEYQTETGFIKDIPGIYDNTPYVSSIMDDDKDGIDDSWELSNGLDPSNINDGSEIKTGFTYTNLEVYLQSL